VLEDPLPHGVEAGGLVHHAAPVTVDTHPGALTVQQPDDRSAGGTRPRHHDSDVGGLLADQAQRVGEGGEDDDRRSVLVVVNTGMSRISRCCRSTSKHRGAAMSSRLTPT